MRTTLTTARRAPTGVLLAGALLAGGCVDSNNRTVLDDNVKLDAFTPWHGLPGSYAPDGPSVKSLSRYNWADRVFEVPVDGTYHRPTYATPFFLTDVTRRKRGEYPSAASCVDLDGSDEFDWTADEQRLGEAFLLPARSFFEALTIPPRLIGEPQCWEEVSPMVSYERWPVDRSIFLAPEPTPRERPETAVGDANPPSAPAPSAPPTPPGERDPR